MTEYSSYHAMKQAVSRPGASIALSKRRINYRTFGTKKSGSTVGNPGRPWL
jgi:hypothetical protein